METRAWDSPCLSAKRFFRSAAFVVNHVLKWISVSFVM
jgi:hypothetical protein